MRDLCRYTPHRPLRGHQLFFELLLSDKGENSLRVLDGEIWDKSIRINWLGEKITQIIVNTELYNL